MKDFSFIDVHKNEYGLLQGQMKISLDNEGPYQLAKQFLETQGLTELASKINENSGFCYNPNDEELDYATYYLEPKYFIALLKELKDKFGNPMLETEKVAYFKLEHDSEGEWSFFTRVISLSLKPNLNDKRQILLHSYQQLSEDDKMTLREYVEAESQSDPGFFRFLFEDPYLEDFELPTVYQSTWENFLNSLKH